jgi:phosphoribosylanthranilate isomerase
VSGPDRPLVKICGMTRRADAEAAAAAGAHFLGVILAPGGTRSVTADAAAIILQGLPVRRVGVFVNAAAPEVLAAVQAARLDVVQLHGDETPELAGMLRARGLVVWKALRPRGGADLAAEAPHWAGAVDALLLDGWSAEARGGTGHAFPWREVAERRDALPAGMALVAAGGLRPENVAEAIRVLDPFAVDVSSGVEAAPGVKDHDAIERFIRAAREARSGPIR